MNRAIAFTASLPAALIATVASAQPACDVGPAAHALAGAITARSGCDYVRWNPAAAYQVAFEEDASVRTHARMSAGGLAGLIDGAIAGSIRVDSTSIISAGINGLHYASYHELEIHATATRMLTGSVTTGIALRCNAQAIDGYGTDASALVDVGIVASAHASLHIGIVARNIGRARMRGIVQPQHIALGMLAMIADSATLSLDIVHESDRDPGIACGFEARVGRRARLRCGIALAAPMIACGVGFDDKQMTIDVALSWSQTVGASCMAGVWWRL